jgi:hypothetical protein
MTSHKALVDECISSKGDLRITARKIYLSYVTEALKDDPEAEFSIRDSISKFFGTGIHCVQIAGSAKTGFSFHQNREFIEGESDLDIAIISSDLYVYYSELISYETKEYTDLGGFGRTKSKIGHDVIMKDNMARYGMILMKLLPRCNERVRISNFFDKLSKDHSRKFREVNAAIYASAYFFEIKQKVSLLLSSRNEK